MRSKKDKILIVDDAEINRSLLKDILSAEYEIVEASNGLQAIEYLNRHIQETTLILLDIIMPVMDGFDVLKIMNKNGWIQFVPVITITSETSSQYINQAYDLGITDYINRPFDEVIVQRRVQNTILLYAKQKMLKDMVTEQILEKERNSLLMVEILSHIVEFRNGESGLHVLHIRMITEFLMKELAKFDGFFKFSDSYISMVVNASALHDIGKIMIPDEILNKPGKLTSEEFEIIKTHSAVGAQMLENVPYYEQEELIQIAHDICRWHHERYDGKGYPDGLKGDEIPIPVQIVAVADVYDALTSKRVYKPAYSHEKAMEMILNGECGAFHPVLMECFRQSGKRLKERISSYTEQEFMRIESQSMKEEFLHNASLSNRSFALLEQEHLKYRFFTLVSKEIQFEYDCKSRILSLSKWGASYLALPEIIVDPFVYPQLDNVFPVDALQRLQKEMESVTPEDPIVELDSQIRIDGELRWFKMYARPLWIDENKHQELTGLIGTCIDVNDEYCAKNANKKEQKETLC